MRVQTKFQGTCFKSPSLYFLDVMQCNDFFWIGSIVVKSVSDRSRFPTENEKFERHVRNIRNDRLAYIFHGPKLGAFVHSVDDFRRPY